MKNQWFLLIFQGPMLPNTIQKRCQNAIEKTSEKNLAKIDFDFHFDFPKPFKITPKSTRDAKKIRVLDKACFATLWTPPRNRRKLTETIVCKASKRLGIWLGLLDLPFVALIIKLSSATWNAYNHCLSSKSPPQNTTEASQNPSKICKNHSKSLSKSCPNSSRDPNAPRKRLFCDFSQFLDPPGLPKIVPKSIKISKKREKIGVAKSHSFKHDFSSIFHGFGFPKWSQDGPLF